MILNSFIQASALITVKFSSPLDGKQLLLSEINSESKRLDTERYSQTNSHGMIPLSQ